MHFLLGPYWPLSPERNQACTVFPKVLAKVTRPSDFEGNQQHKKKGEKKAGEWSKEKCKLARIFFHMEVPAVNRSVVNT